MNYITRWDVSLATQARLVAVVLGAVPSEAATLRAVWAPTREEVISGASQFLTAEMGLPSEGLFATEWVAISEDAIAAGDIYVGIALNAIADVSTLIFGIVEVQIR